MQPVQSGHEGGVGEGAREGGLHVPHTRSLGPPPQLVHDAPLEMAEEGKTPRAPEGLDENPGESHRSCFLSIGSGPRPPSIPEAEPGRT